MSAGHQPEKGQYGGNPPHLSDLFVGLGVGTHVDQTLYHGQEEVHIVAVQLTQQDRDSLVLLHRVLTQTLVTQALEEFGCQSMKNGHKLMIATTIRKLLRETQALEKY